MRKWPDMSETNKRQPIWSNLWPRSISAVIMAAVLFVPFYFGGIYWIVTILILGLRAIWEWVKMTDIEPPTLAFLIPMSTLIAGLYVEYVGLMDWFLPIVLGGVGLSLIERIIRKKGEWFWSPFGVVYIVVPCVAAVILRGAEPGIYADGFKLLSYLMLVVIAADVGAYFGGSFFKGPKLVPKLSPKKTWSGLISGILLGVVFGALMGLALAMGPQKAAIIAIPVVLISVFGDFLESGVKRRMDVKDASDILPGHGGLLDRLDSVLMVVLAAYICKHFFDYMVWI